MWGRASISRSGLTAPSHISTPQNLDSNIPDITTIIANDTLDVSRSECSGDGSDSTDHGYMHEKKRQYHVPSVVPML